MHLLLLGGLDAKFKCAGLPGAMAQMGLHHLFLQLTAYCCKSCTVVPKGFRGVEGIRAGISPLFFPLTKSRARSCAVREEQDLLCWKICVTKL